MPRAGGDTIPPSQMEVGMRKFARSLLPAVSMLFLVSGYCSADPVMYLDKWSALKDKDYSGVPFCAIAVTPSADKPQKNIVITSRSGTDYLVLSMFKDSWDIPNGEPVVASIDFMDDQPLRIKGYGSKHVVRLEIPSQVLVAFVSMMKDSKQMRVKFLTGEETPWVASLRSSNHSLIEFLSCMRGMEHTQPY